MVKQIAGLVLGLALGLGATEAVLAQATPNPKITANGGWALCVDFQARDVALSLSVDGSAAVPASGVIWEGTAAPFQAKLPLSDMPASARTVGVHTATVTAPSQTVTMADGSTLDIPGGSVALTYEVIATQGPAPSNPRWIRILGVIVAAAGGFLTWLVSRG